MEFDRKALSQYQATAERYHAGITDQTVEYLAGRGIIDNIVDDFMLGTCDDIHDGWLSIPYLRAPHGTLWFNYRNLSGHGSKYASPGKKHLFNTIDLDQSDKSGEICIAEGEIDTITASALCGLPCVGVPGATQWTGNAHWWELFRGYQVVWVLADPDEAGLGLASAIMDTLPAARLVKLPSDVNETYLAEGDIKGYLR